MATLGSRARQRRNRDLLLGSLALLVVAAVVVGAAYTTLTSTPGADKHTLCPASGPTGHWVLLVDKTDPLSFTQQQAFDVLLRQLVAQRTPPGTLLSLFVLGEDFKTTAKPLVELCNPGTGASQSELTANLAKLRQQYETRFVAPLLQQSQALVASQPAAASPIFEMLQLVGINGFASTNAPGERRLIILSDMLHSTPQLNMYKTPPDFAAFSASDYGKRAQASLPGVVVELHYLLHTPALQTKRNLKFWEDYFHQAGARIVAVQPLEG